MKYENEVVNLKSMFGMFEGKDGFSKGNISIHKE